MINTNTELFQLVQLYKLFWNFEMELPVSLSVNKARGSLKFRILWRRMSQKLRIYSFKCICDSEANLGAIVLSCFLEKVLNLKRKLNNKSSVIFVKIQVRCRYHLIMHDRLGRITFNKYRKYFTRKNKYKSWIVGGLLTNLF